MRSGLMEGLIGASRNMKIVDTPMRVYAEDEVELSEEGKALVSEIMQAEQLTISTVDNLVGYNKLGNVIKETGEEKISVKI